MSKTRIKVKDSYIHPTSGALIVRYEFDNGFQGSAAFPPDVVTEEQIDEFLERQYERENKLQSAEHKQKVADLIAKLKVKEKL